MWDFFFRKKKHCGKTPYMCFRLWKQKLSERLLSLRARPWVLRQVVLCRYGVMASASYRFVSIPKGPFVFCFSPWAGLLTIVPKSVNQRGGVGTEGWVNPVKTFEHQTLCVFHINNKDRFYRRGTHLKTFVYDAGSSEIKLWKRLNTRHAFSITRHGLRSRWRLRLFQDITPF